MTHIHVEVTCNDVRIKKKARICIWAQKIINYLFILKDFKRLKKKKKYNTYTHTTHTLYNINI